MVYIYHMASRLAAVLYKALLLCLSIALLLYILQTASATVYEKIVKENPGQFLDCRVFSSFGSLARSDFKSDLYDYNTQAEWFKNLHAGSVHASYVPYPPAFALLWIILSFLPENYSYLLWSLASLAVFVLGLLSLSQSFQIKKLDCFWVIIATLASIPSWRSVALGQTSLFCTGLMAFFLLAWKKGNPWASAAALNLLLLKPTLAVLPGTALFSKKDLKALLFSMAMAAIILLLASLVIGLRPIISYPLALAQSMTHPPQSFHVEDMTNLRGLLASIDIHFGPAATLFFLAAIICNILVFRSKSSTTELKFSFLVFASLAFATHIHLYECTMLSIPALLLLKSDPANKPEAFIKKLLLVYPLLSWIAYIAFYQKSHLFFTIFALLNLTMSLTTCFWIFKKARSQKELLSDAKALKPEEET